MVPRPGDSPITSFVWPYESEKVPSDMYDESKVRSLGAESMLLQVFHTGSTA